MSIQVRGRSGLLRALAVLGVVAGVFAMHGLTGNHAAAMAGVHMDDAPGAARAPVAGQHMIPVDHSLPVAVVGVSDPAVMVSRVARFVPVGDDHAMAGACVAVLTALVLLLALALALRSLLAWRPVGPSAPLERPVLTGRSPPWVVPSLSKLCVLRA